MKYLFIISVLTLTGCASSNHSDSYTNPYYSAGEYTVNSTALRTTLKELRSREGRIKPLTVIAPDGKRYRVY